ncbi:MAG: alpha/beta hydrolase [Trueperaceae bacterium]|nr:alpha/beta hydrolase [Trueperaceae bacterium]
MTKLITVEEVLALDKAMPDHVLSYGTHPEQFAHLYLPMERGPYPTVILLHGGCWRSSVSLDYFGQAARNLSKLGLAVWNLEYRRIENGGGWPTTFLDVASGTDYLQNIASIYNLDLSRTLALGHSAGGHLAHWLAARKNLPPTSELYQPNPLGFLGFISLAGIPDLELALRDNICSNQAPKELIGGTPEEFPERYAQASPARLAPIGGQQIFIQGTQDDTVQLIHIEDYVKKAKARGEDIRLITLQNTGHFELVVSTTPQWQIVEEKVMQLFGMG